MYNGSSSDKNGNSRHCGNHLLPWELWPEQNKPWGDFNFCPRFISIVLISTQDYLSNLLDKTTLLMFSGPGCPRLSSQRRRLESFWFQGMSDHHASSYHLVIIEEKSKKGKRNRSWVGCAVHCDKVAQTSLGRVLQLQWLTPLFQRGFL